MLVFVIEESVKPVVPTDAVKSLIDAVGLNPVEVTTIEAPGFPVTMVEEVKITGAEPLPQQYDVSKHNLSSASSGDIVL